MFTCVYRTPSDHSDKNGKLNDVIRQLCNKEYSHKLVVGDFNYPQIDWDVYSNQSTVEDDSHRFIDYVHVSGPTRGRGISTPLLIDLVMTNDPPPLPPSELLIT